MDLPELMRMATKLRESMASVQAEVENSRVVGEAGGGLVRAVMNGRHELVELSIDPRTFVPSEVALVEDLIRAAVNQASSKATDLLKERMGGVAQGLGLDPSLLGRLG